MSRPINTCVLGVGLSGLTFHVPFILALPSVFTLHSVLERNPRTPGGKVKERFGVDVKIYRSLDDVLADPEVELVIIGTPNDTHYSFAKAVLNAGKHVLVDKPVTATFEQAKELGALAKSKSLVLYAFQNRRWDSDFLALKKLLAQPEVSPHSLGAITEFESHFDRYRKGLKGTWKDQPLPAAGLTFDLGSHLIDQALCLFGRPARITAFIQNLRGVGHPEVDDSFTIYMQYNTGPRSPLPLTVILRSHILSVRSPQIRYIVRGTQGSYIKYGIDVQEDQLKVISTPDAILEDQYGREPEDIWGTVERMEADDLTVTKARWPSSDAGAYVELFKNLGAAIRDGAELAVKWEEASAVVEMIELAHESAREGRTIAHPPMSSAVEVTVDLPSYSLSFPVKVHPSDTVLQLKQAISHACPGQPRADGQRLIWRGRLLADHEAIDSLWKTEPRIVHLAVHPSAWSSTPPTIPQSLPHTQPQPQPTPTINPGIRWTSNPPRAQPTTSSQAAPPAPLTFVSYIHHKALSYLSTDIPPPAPLENASAHRSTAVQTLERNGWTWPAIFDEEYPPSSEGGVQYNIAVIDGQSFLQLSSAKQRPTPAQEHAIKVLSYTFSILSMSLPATPTVRTIQSQSATVPPHVNQLLQQLGIPPLRAANPNNGNPVLANQNNPVFAEIREIPIRPLLAPLIMLVFRTTLLLYFVAPTRKPIFGILILAWMLYEIWRPIRDGMRNNWGRLPANQPPRVNNGQAPVVPAGQNPAPPAPGAVPLANVAPRPGAAGPVTFDMQVGALFETFANLNIEQEERMLNRVPGTPTEEPGLGHKVMTFLSLFVTTLHPAIWNRRRVALRRREGVIRTEANVRNAPAPSLNEGETELTPEQSTAARRREELLAQFNQRPRWIREYIERVVDEDWVDDSD